MVYRIVLLSILLQIAALSGPSQASHIRLLQEVNEPEDLIIKSSLRDPITVHPLYAYSFDGLTLSPNFAKSSCFLTLRVPKDLEETGLLQSSDAIPTRGFYSLGSLMTRSESSTSAVYTRQTTGNTVDAIFRSLRLTIRNLTLPESTAWRLVFDVDCQSVSDNVEVTLIYSKTIPTQTKSDQDQVSIISGKVFSEKLALIKVPNNMIPYLNVRFSENAAQISFANFRVYKGYLIVEGDAPSVTRGHSESYYTTVHITDSKVGMRSEDIPLRLLVLPPPPVSWQAIFLVIIIIGSVAMLVCLAVLLGRQSASDNVKLVTEAVSTRQSNDMLTHSVIEWKKKEVDLDKSQLDQTAVDEVYMFKEVEIKRNKQYRAFELDEMNRPFPMDLNLLQKKFSKEDILTPGYSLNNTLNNTLDFRKMSGGNDITVDMSPIKIKQGTRFEVNTPNSSVIMSDSKPGLTKTLSSGIKLNSMLKSDKKQILEDMDSPLPSQIHNACSAETPDSPMEPGSADSNNKYKLTDFGDIEEEDHDEVKYDCDS